MVAPQAEEISMQGVEVSWVTLLGNVSERDSDVCEDMA